MSLRPESSGMVSGAHPGSRRRAVLFLPSYQRPRTSLSGGSTSLLLLSPAKTAHETEERGLSVPRANFASQVVPPWSCPGTVVPSVAHCDSASSCGAQFLFHKLLPTQNIGRQLEIGGLGVFQWWCRIARKWKEGSWGWRESRRGCEGGMHTLLVCTPSAPSRDCCVYTAVRIFLKSPF